MYQIINKKKEINKLFEDGKYVKGHLLSIHFLENKLNSIRFCIFLTKKIKKAVIRNRIKRRIKAALIPAIEHIKCGYDLLLIPNEKVYYSKFDEIKNTIYETLKKANLVR